MRNSRTKKMILNAILLGIGLIMHQIFPALGGGVTPDISLVMLFCIMIINRDDYKACLISGIIAGIFAAMTTKFPAGQLPNFVDKIITVNIMYGVMKLIYINPLTAKLGKRGDQIAIITMTFIGTLVSGFAFLSLASVMVGLPVALTKLFIAVVLPATLINVVTSVILFNVIVTSLKRTSFQLN
ncbi:MAG: tryptophan transporter [Peptostreptococcus sp.]|uniref:tryptophan transporter n=1 Tax=Peptostreptococcus sp. TaxID=1262 RepID=UPI002FC927BF